MNGDNEDYAPTDWWWHDPEDGAQAGFVLGRPAGDGDAWRVYRRLPDGVVRGMEQASRGELLDLGSFAQYADDPTHTAHGQP